MAVPRTAVRLTVSPCGTDGDGRALVSLGGRCRVTGEPYQVTLPSDWVRAVSTAVRAAHPGEGCRVGTGWEVTREGDANLSAADRGFLQTGVAPGGAMVRQAGQEPGRREATAAGLAVSAGADTVARGAGIGGRVTLTNGTCLRFDAIPWFARASAAAIAVVFRWSDDEESAGRVATMVAAYDAELDAVLGRLVGAPTWGDAQSLAARYALDYAGAATWLAVHRPTVWAEVCAALETGRAREAPAASAPA